MIVGEKKPFGEIWGLVKDFRKVFVIGCNTCVAICHAGGEKEAEALASMLRIKASQEGMPMEVGSGGIERQCETEYFSPVLETLRGQDVVISTACGVGVNFLADIIGDNVPVFPGINTSFYGGVPKPGVFTELCAGCGNCIVHLTGGICPIARCSKSLMNGPCGGTNKGKCEVSDEVDCAWYLIVERMKKLGTLDKLLEIQPPRNWATAAYGGPRRVVVEHVMDLEEQEEQKAQEGGR